MASVGALADADARVAIRRADTAAAVVARAAHHSVDLAIAERRPGRRQCAMPACANAGATIGARRAAIAALVAEGRNRADAVRAQLRTAVIGRCAGMAQRRASDRSAGI